MNDITKKHQEKFNKNPKIIGLFFDNPEITTDNIVKAIEENKPYNEYNLLTKEDEKLFRDGKLFF